jgi:hypothetical protein
VPRLIGPYLNAKAAAFYHSDTDRLTWAGSTPDGFAEEQLRRGLDRPNILQAGVPGFSVVPIHCGKNSIGTLAICGGNISESSVPRQRKWDSLRPEVKLHM